MILVALDNTLDFQYMTDPHGVWIPCISVGSLLLGISTDVTVNEIDSGTDKTKMQELKNQSGLEVSASLVCCVMLVMMIAPTTRGLTTPTLAVQERDKNRVQVWDNVLDAATAKILHQVASQKGLGHTLLNRQQQQIQQQVFSPLEYAMSHILRQINDTSPYVEYWTRQEWRHIEAHADIDEYRAKTSSDDDYLRYPTHGHVLYLEIGPMVRGPTCLFPHCSSGGDLVLPPHKPEDDLKVVTVPAVTGRLLRFPGHWLHAVPRPTDVWMLPFVKGSPDFSEDYVRSVVLFNTWTKEPPLQVEALENNEDSCTDNEMENGVHAFDLWREREVLDSQESSLLSQKTKIWLLGDLKRRNYTMRTVPLYSNGDVLREALNEKSQPKATPLSKVAIEA